MNEYVATGGGAVVAVAMLKLFLDHLKRVEDRHAKTLQTFATKIGKAVDRNTKSTDKLAVATAVQVRATEKNTDLLTHFVADQTGKIAEAVKSKSDESGTAN